MDSKGRAVALCVALSAPGAFAGVPEHLKETLSKVKFSGGLANPLTEFTEARWERQLQQLPYQRYTNLKEYWEASEFNSIDGTSWTNAGESRDGAADADDAPCDDDNPCDAMPQEFSWYAFHGVGLLTHNLNQHLPQYCADCWLTAPSSMVADRIKIARYAMGGALGPDVNIAMQTVLNCGKRIAGTCTSGTVHGVFDYIQDSDGIPYDTCQNYEATDSMTCTAPTYCKACKTEGLCFGVPAEPSWDPKGFGYWFNGVPKVELQEWGYIGTLMNNTVRDLQIEIITRGPIACMVDPRPLNSYKEGVIDAEWDAQVGYAHVLEVVGWGEKDGEKFWHVRNSWGEYWGERGFGRVLRGAASSTAHGSIGIEGMCAWAVPNKWGQVMKSFGMNIDGMKDKSSKHHSDAGGSIAANATVYDDEGGPIARASGGGDSRNATGSLPFNETADDASSESAPTGALAKSMFDDVTASQSGQWDRERVESLWRRARSASVTANLQNYDTTIPSEYVAPAAQLAARDAGSDGEAHSIGGQGGLGSYNEPGGKSLRAAPASDGDGNRDIGAGSSQSGLTQDGSYDQPSGGTPQLDAGSDGEAHSIGGQGGLGSYNEPGGKSLRAAPASDGDGNQGIGAGSAQSGLTQDGSYDQPTGGSPQLAAHGAGGGEAASAGSSASGVLLALVGASAGIAAGFLGGFLSGRKFEKRQGFDSVF